MDLTMASFVKTKLLKLRKNLADTLPSKAVCLDVTRSVLLAEEFEVIKIRSEVTEMDRDIEWILNPRVTEVQS
ncbi:hypothetical protein ACEPAG_455 [Sanghuangporus baumii]